MWDKWWGKISYEQAKKPWFTRLFPVIFRCPLQGSNLWPTDWSPLLCQLSWGQEKLYWCPKKLHGLYWTRAIKQVGNSSNWSCFRVRRPTCDEDFVSLIIQKIVGQHLSVKSYTTAFLYLYDTTFLKKIQRKNYFWKVSQVRNLSMVSLALS